MNLFLVELKRLRFRRAVVVLVAACVLATVIVFGATAWSTRPVSDAELRQAQEQVERDRDSRFFERELARCERSPNQYGVQDATGCAETIGPQVDWYLSRPALRMGEALHGPGLGLITLLMALLMLAGTTFAGADWTSGSMSNQLLFEPRRHRVWLAKAAAVAALAAVASAALLASFWGAMALLASGRGIETPPEVTDQILASSARSVVLIAAAAVGAYAVTMLFRSTVFTLGAMFAIAIGAAAVIAVIGLSEAWLPNKNLGAVIWDGTRYYTEPPAACLDSPRPPKGVDCSGMRRLSLWQGARNLGVLLVVAVGASLWSFRRRDVP